MITRKKPLLKPIVLPVYPLPARVYPTSLGFVPPATGEFYSFPISKFLLIELAIFLFPSNLALFSSANLWI